MKQCPGPLNSRRRLLLKAIAAVAAGNPVLSRWALAGRPMETIYRTIPGSNETLPLVGLGTSRVFDVGLGTDELQGPREVLSALADVKNAMVDTSPMYGDAERVVGDVMAELGVRDRVFLATKVWTHGRKAGVDQMNRSFQLLRTNRIDLMQIHNLVDWQTHIRTLREWKEQGRIRYIGATHYHDGAHDELARIMRSEALDFIQINYSPAEPEAENQVLPLALERGMAVIVNRPFARGSLFRAVRGRKLPDWAGELDIHSWAQFFLKWIISHPSVSVAIPATSKKRHMVDNLGAAQGRLPDEAQRQRMFAYLSDIL